MNRYIRILLLLCSVIAMSCGAEPADPFDDVRLPEHTVFAADFKALTFADTSRTPTWAKGDCIGIFGSEQGQNERYVLKKAGDGQQKAEFYGPEVSGERIRAYYPYAEGYELHDGHLSFEMLPDQEWSGETTLHQQYLRYVKTAFAFSNGTDTLTFAYPQGLMTFRFFFEKDVKITGLVLTSPSRNLAGTGYVTDDWIVEMKSAVNYPVTLDCGDGVSPAAYVFPVVLPAGSYEDLRLAVHVGGTDPYVCHLEPVEIPVNFSGDLAMTEVSVSIGDSSMGFDVIPDMELE